MEFLRALAPWMVIVLLSSCGGDDKNPTPTNTSQNNTPDLTASQERQACLNAGFNSGECEYFELNEIDFRVFEGKCTTTGTFTICSTDPDSLNAEAPEIAASSLRVDVSSEFDYNDSPIYELEISANKKGDAVAYWIVSNRQSGLMSNRFRGGVWQGEQVIAPGIISSPDVHLNPQGNAAAIWSQFNSAIVGRTEVYAAFHRNDAWAEATQISVHSSDPDTSSGVSNPKISLHDDGTALAVWALEETQFIPPKAISTPTTVYYSRFDGSVWSAPKKLSDGIHSVNGGSLQLIARGNGDGLVIWSQAEEGTDNDPRISNIHASFYHNGELSSVQRVTHLNVGSDIQLSGIHASINESGHGVLLWRENVYRETFRQLKTHSFDLSNASFSTNSMLVAESAMAGDVFIRSAVHTDEQGNILVNWVQNLAAPGESAEGWFRFFDADTQQWSVAARFEDISGTFPGRLASSAFTNKQAAFAWHDFDIDKRPFASNAVIRLRKYHSNTGLAEQILNIGYGYDPRMIAGPSGSIYLVALKYGSGILDSTTKVISIQVTP